ncbi:MAG: hypothetical protein U5J62_08975 [Desulfurivibrio sp.]|nr:hypothetical protein [Desulfurivibrio sp.]
MPTTWLTLQPSLLATTAWLLLLAAWQLRGGRQREATVSIIVYSTIMLVDVSWPLLLAPEPLLLPVALGLLLPPLLILVPWSLTTAPRPLRRYTHVAATIHPCRT